MARVARRLGIPVIAIPGSVGRDVGGVHGIGIEAYVSALQETMTEEDVAARGPAMLEDGAAQVGRLLALRFPGRAALRRRRLLRSGVRKEARAIRVLEFPQMVCAWFMESV